MKLSSFALPRVHGTSTLPFDPLAQESLSISQTAAHSPPSSSSLGDMSALYNLEPQPTASLTLHTTLGPLSLELFAKQTPLTCRNFLQLALDGYYDATVFHRLVPGFVLQGGDPTGTGSGGEAIYPGGLFEDEFHSRLKFNRRGLLGMANGGEKNDNGSQFFLTLGEAKELQGRNTMFGRVAGDSIYNLMKMGEGEVGVDDRPLYPVRIERVEILVNPFEDMVRTERRKAPAVQKSVEKGMGMKNKGKRKGGGKTLLSFGGVEGEDEGGDGEEGAILPAKKKAKFNPKLVSGDTTVEREETAKPKQPATEKIRRKRTPSPASPPTISRTKTTAPTARSRSPSSSPSPSPPPPASTSALDRTNAEISLLKASMKRSSHLPTTSSQTKHLSALESLIPATSTRGRKRKAGASSDREALAILHAFKSKLASAPVVISSHSHPPSSTLPAPSEITTAEDEEAGLCDLHFIANCASCRAWDADHPDDAPERDGDEDDEKGWMNHRLTFAKDRLGKDLTWKKQTAEGVVVLDPRETLKEESKGKGKGRDGGGAGSGAWERDRARAQ